MFASEFFAFYKKALVFCPNKNDSYNLIKAEDTMFLCTIENYNIKQNYL